MTNYTYDQANRLINAGNINYTWDNNGNLTNDGSTLYRYDQANRLISTTLSGATTLFNYNGDGVRLKQIVAGVPTTYTQDIAAPLPVVLQAKTGTTAMQYLYSMGTRPVAQYTSSAWQYLLPDALGSVRQIADANGNVTLAESYEPYGSVLSSTGSATSIFGYAGEQFDTTGLIYLRARYLQPSLGIFLSRDPWSGDVMRPGSMNGFNYGLGNPVLRADPSGECPICWIIIAILATACSSDSTSQQPAPTLLPTSSAEPPYEPGKWNDGAGMQRTNNCYSYAADDFEGHIYPGLPQPGVAGGLTAVMDFPIHCSNLVFRMKVDGFIEHDCDTACDAGTYKAMVYTSKEPEGIGNYHMYRQDQGGYWSHKPGERQVTNLDADGKKISDPRIANRTYEDADYATPCGCFCVKRGTKTQTWTPNPEGP